MTNHHNVLAKCIYTAVFVFASCTFLYPQMTKGEVDSLVNIRIDSLLNKEKGIKYFEFVGGGDLNGISSEDQSLQAGNISFGIHMLREFEPGTTTFLQDLEVDFAMNVASSLDSINGAGLRDPIFGSYILQPLNSEFSARLDLTSLFRNQVNRGGKVSRAAAAKEKGMLEILNEPKEDRDSTIILDNEILVGLGLQRETKLSELSEIELELYKLELEKQIYSLTHSARTDFQRNEADKRYTLFNRLIEGAYLNLYADKTLWTVPNTSAQTAFTYQANFGFFHELLPNVTARNERISIRLGLGYSYRAVTGDISQPIITEDRIDIAESERTNLERIGNLTNFIGGDRKRFHGIDASLIFVLDRLKVEAKLPFIFANRNRQIPGLTNSQFVWSIRFVGGIDFFADRNRSSISTTPKT